jgi:hypothetical protein
MHLIKSMRKYMRMNGPPPIKARGLPLMWEGWNGGLGGPAGAFVRRGHVRRHSHSRTYWADAATNAEMATESPAERRRAPVLIRSHCRTHIWCMTSEALNHDDNHDEHRRTRRPCLRCQTIFDSAWAGERICMRCKGSSAWRNGGPLESRESRSRSTRSRGS